MELATPPAGDDPAQDVSGDPWLCITGGRQRREVAPPVVDGDTPGSVSKEDGVR